jgi:hypothetical protein
VCFDCGNTDFGLSETELGQLVARRSEGVYDADARRAAFRDRGRFGDGLNQHYENVLGFAIASTLKRVYTQIDTSQHRRSAYPKGN